MLVLKAAMAMRTSLLLLFLFIASLYDLPVCLAKDQIRIAYFSQDPPSIDSLSPSFDPDSYAVIAQLFDTLVYMDLDGTFKPGLATEWRQLSPTRWKFSLRKNVKFHNGEIFDANAVKFTFDYILNPKNNSGNRWIFNSLDKVSLVENEPYEIIFDTKFPDGMFLNRFNLFGSICPPQYIKEKGFVYFQNNPIGTGPYQFVEWSRGKEIILRKNPNYWMTGIPYIENVHFVLQEQKKWIEGFVDDKIDFIPNLGGSHTSLLMKHAKGHARIIKRPVLLSYWVMLKNHGSLADIRVRKALNYAVNKADIIKFADFGNALPMASLGKQGEFGANEGLNAYFYDKQKARALLSESGVSLPLTYKVLVADVAEPAAKIIQRNLADIDINLQLEVVSRSEWTKRVVVYKIITGKRPDYDMVINLVDNPIYNLAFHAGLFLESSSPWSLLQSDEFDEKLADSLMVTDTEVHEKKLKDLDQYIHENALMLFTTQKIITAAIRENFDIRQFGANGHLDYEILTKARELQTP